MDRINKPGTTNQRTLWHGTTGGAVNDINATGFNRSYSGKNGNMVFCLAEIFTLALRFFPLTLKVVFAYDIYFKPVSCSAREEHMWSLRNGWQ